MKQIIFQLFNLSILSFFVLLNCNQTTNKSVHLIVGKDKNDNSNLSLTNNKIYSLTKKNEEEKRIIDTIFKLAEVRERAKYIKQHSKGKRELKVWIRDTPKQPNKKYYWIQVGEDNGTNLVSHFNFFVYPDTMLITYLDAKSDQEILLDKWRK